MSNFILFFDEKEGTSPLVRLLDQFPEIDIVHQVGGRGWEPFDFHNCGPITIKDMKRCMELIYAQGAVDMDELNAIYGKSAKHLLKEIGASVSSVGLKMRFTAPGLPLPGNIAPLSRAFGALTTPWFKEMMFETLSRNEVKVLIAVRQDILRWALSKYHGDGSGKSGHLQFKLASGEITHNDIGKINVDCSKLEKIVDYCRRRHQFKRSLVDELSKRGVATCPVCYEDFLSDPVSLLMRILGVLDIDADQKRVDGVVSGGTNLKKVHSDDISDFVVNYEEVLEKFDDAFVSWA